MLVVTRRIGERILIGEDIVVQIIDVRGDGVRVGIDAPKGIRIQRLEVVEALAEANAAAVESADDGTAQALAELLAPHQRDTGS